MFGNQVMFTVLSFFSLCFAASQADAQTAVDDFVWVTSRGGNHVTKVRKSTNTIVAQIDVGNATNGVAVDPQWVWVGRNGQALVRIEKSNHSLTTVDLSAHGNPVGVATDTDSVWVAIDGGTHIARVNKATLAVTSINVGMVTWGVAVDDTHAWFGNHTGTEVIKIDKGTNEIVAFIDTGDVAPHGIALDDTYAYVALHNTSQIARIDKVTHQVVRVNGHGGNYGVAVDGTWAWFGCPANGDLLRASLSDLEDQAVFSAGEGDEGVGVCLDSSSVWMVHRVSNSLLRFNRTTGDLITTIEDIDPDDQFPEGLTMFGDATGFAYDFFFDTPQTPQQVIDAILLDVDALVADGTLTTGQGNALHQKLENALAKLNAGAPDSVVENKIHAFINQVEALIAGGVLTQLEGETLIDAAEAVLSLLSP